MKATRQFLVVLVTAPDRRVARKLAAAALQARLVACANLVFRVESHYWWRGKLETSSEVLILFKTTVARFDALERLVLDKHPYDTPEIIALPITTGTRRYLDWLAESVTPLAPA
jgi:periplasmic divalent cation tolerance protein